MLDLFRETTLMLAIDLPMKLLRKIKTKFFFVKFQFTYSIFFLLDVFIQWFKKTTYYLLARDSNGLIFSH